MGRPLEMKSHLVFGNTYLHLLLFHIVNPDHTSHIVFVERLYNIIIL